jgi:hypothetical protein
VVVKSQASFPVLIVSRQEKRKEDREQADPYQDQAEFEEGPDISEIVKRAEVALGAHTVSHGAGHQTDE